MPKIEKHAPGAFCYIELSTSDQNAAKKFYTSLFGWSIKEFPMGPGDIYTMFQVDGADAAACYTARPEERAQGVPPHWNLYIATANADETAKKAGTLGGKVLAQPFDVMDQGRMAVVQDPTGAAFCIWQAAKGIGIQIGGVSGTLCWADLSTGDPGRAKTFYEGLFGWQVTLAENDSSGYLHIKNGKEFIGGIPPAEFRNPNLSAVLDDLHSGGRRGRFGGKGEGDGRGCISGADERRERGAHGDSGRSAGRGLRDLHAVAAQVDASGLLRRKSAGADRSAVHVSAAGDAAASGAGGMPRAGSIRQDEN